MDFLLFRLNIDFYLRLHRIVRYHQQTQMTAFLTDIPFHHRHTQAGAFTRLQQTLLQTDTYRRMEYLQFAYL